MTGAMSRVYELYQKLSDAFGPSGREDAVRDVITEHVRAYVDDIRTDALGNLICRKKRMGKKLLFAAHMDTTGIVATSADENGFLRFAPVGGLHWQEILSAQVQFENGVCGMIACEEKTPLREVSFNNLFIDTGVSEKTKASCPVRPGDFAVWKAPRFEQNGMIGGPYLDNRIGCAALLLALEQLASMDTKNDLYFVFTVQEEVGLRGAGAAAFAVAPDLAVAVDVTDAGGQPALKTPVPIALGKGPAIKIMDRSVICAPSVRARLEEAAASCGIVPQREILPFGGTDTAALQRARAGIPAGAVSIPVRYIHTPAELCAVSDVEDTARLLAAFACLSFAPGAERPEPA